MTALQELHRWSPPLQLTSWDHMQLVQHYSKQGKVEPQEKMSSWSLRQGYDLLIFYNSVHMREDRKVQSREGLVEAGQGSAALIPRWQWLRHAWRACFTTALFLQTIDFFRSQQRGKQTSKQINKTIQAHKLFPMVKLTIIFLQSWIVCTLS